jgi:type VI secretion system protein ImpG
MDARLLRYYNQELRYLRETGGEFAQEFPKIAARLGMEGLEVSDPYVERLLEGCAFLAARIQLKQDAEFPRFSHRLLELVYPNFLAPVPSMMVAQVHPVPGPNLLAGHRVARGASLVAPATPITPTRCEFRTAQDLVLTPLKTASAEYFLNMSDLSVGSLALKARPRAGVRLRLQLPEGMSIAQLSIDALEFFIGGQVDVSMQLHELMLSSFVGALVGAPGRLGDGSAVLLPPEALSPMGYDDDQAMLPTTLRGFAGTRVLQEYFAFPERFLFVRLGGLRAALSPIKGNVVEIALLFSRPGQGLDGAITPDCFRLHCVPAVNLFPKRADRIDVSDGAYEFHVVPDRTVPLDYEVYDVLSMSGFDDQGDERRFSPLFAPDRGSRVTAPAYYTIWREPRLMSEKARRDGPRSGYIGSEVFVSLVDIRTTRLFRSRCARSRCRPAAPTAICRSSCRPPGRKGRSRSMQASRSRRCD